MKTFFTGVLVLNLLIEGFAATTLIGAPEMMFAEGHEAGAMWARLYGFAVLAIGTTVFWIWPNREDIRAVGSVLGVLLTFHTSVFVALATSAGQLGNSIIHGVMAALCIFLYTQRSKWCTV